MSTISPRSEAKSKGLKKYFTGNPCKHGHISERHTDNGACVSCTRLMMTSPVRVEYEAKYYQANKDRVSARASEYYSQNRDKYINSAKVWTENNKQKRQLISTNYKSRRRSWENDGVTFSELAHWRESQAKVCHWCGIDCAGKFHIDHVMPLSRGGKHELNNLAISCQPCNSRKSNKLPDVFAAQVGRIVVSPDMVKAA